VRRSWGAVVGVAVEQADYDTGKPCRVERRSHLEFAVLKAPQLHQGQFAAERERELLREWLGLGQANDQDRGWVRPDRLGAGWI